MANIDSDSNLGVEVFREPVHTDDDVRAIAKDAACSRPSTDPGLLAAERQTWLKGCGGRVVLEPRTHLQVIFPRLLWSMSTTIHTGQRVSLAVDLDPDSHRYRCLVRGDAKSRTVMTVRCATSAEIAHAETASVRWRTALCGGHPPAPPRERTNARFLGAVAGLTRFSVAWHAWSRPDELKNVPFQFWRSEGEEAAGGRYWISASAVIDATCEDSIWERVRALFYRAQPTICIQRQSDFVPSINGPYGDFEGRTNL
jgi:hypothetical protein